MRNIATCYSEHAVKVSDSYCSGPLNKSYVSPKSTPSNQNIVTFTYKAKISNNNNNQLKCLLITITWCANKLINQGFFIKISEKTHVPSNSGHGFHQITKPNGHKSLSITNSNEVSKVDVHWDLSSAYFDAAAPNPQGGFYIIITVENKLALVLGDMNDCHVVKDTIAGLMRPKFLLVSQCGHFTGHLNNQINTTARFSETGIEHEITIKCCPEDEGPRNPVLSVYVDKKRVVRVKKLQWNFRGNQVIFVDGLLVDVMWDVYGWYFDEQQQSSVVGRNKKSGGGCGLFMFRTRSGLDSRLWLEEEEKKLCDNNNNNLDKPEFSLLICVSSKNPD